jgi:hypothetical protein
MQPIYYIIGSNELLGMVFKNKDNHKTILMLSKEIDLQYGIRFIDKVGNYMDDSEVEDIIKNFIFWKE